MVFNSSDLYNPFFIPVTRFELFDIRVTSEQFANILSSNAVVDVGRGDFSIRVYHTRIPRGGVKKDSDSPLLDGFGILTDRWLARKKSVVTVPREYHPYCLVAAMQLALFKQTKSKKKHFLPLRIKSRNAKIRELVDIRLDCGLVLRANCLWMI